MKFYEDQIFHIYNQGNNRRQIFFSDENYHYFLWKMRAYLLPFGDFIGWCLMPNHYHWLFYVKHPQISRKILRTHLDAIEFKRRIAKYGKNAQPVNRSPFRQANAETLVSLNDAIGMLQSSYTAAINRQQDWSGSLFRVQAKAKDGWIDEFITLTKNGRENYHFQLGNGMAYHCLNYLHENPVTANLVEIATQYRWSSAMEYANLRKGSLCNLELGRKLIGTVG